MGWLLARLLLHLVEMVTMAASPLEISSNIARVKSRILSTTILVCLSIYARSISVKSTGVR
jgi:hypothetical protein